MLKAPGFTPSSDAGAASAPGAPRGGSHPGAGPQQQETAGRGTRGGRPQGDDPQLLPGMDVIPL